MSGKILTISVAAYNVEKFINKCLDSFVESGVIDDVEIIVTDDGSKDNTPDIVKEYSLKYPTSIILVRQENAGPGSTVNSGISHASGKYFRMVDGDDWVNPTEFSKLVNKLKGIDCDAVIHNFCEVDNNTYEEVPHSVDNLPVNVSVHFCDIADRLSSVSMHNLVVKTEIMKDYVILDNCFYTDMQYLIFPIRYIKTVMYLDYYVYMYRVSLGTQSMNPKSMQKNIDMHTKVLFSLVNYFEDYRKSSDCNESVLCFLKNRINIMAGAQIFIYLSFKPSKHNKRNMFKFLSTLEKSSKVLYNSFAKIKTVRVLNFCSLLYCPLSWMVRCKNKIK